MTLNLGGSCRTFLPIVLLCIFFTFQLLCMKHHEPCRSPSWEEVGLRGGVVQAGALGVVVVVAVVEVVVVVVVVAVVAAAMLGRWRAIFP